MKIAEPPMKSVAQNDRDRGAISAIRTRLEGVLKGKPVVIQRVLECLLSRGHLLLEDRPGLGKTTLAKALAAAIGGSFARLQCTPDLLPSDVTGFSIFDQRTQDFVFRSGPVFADVLLADEINRATPRTQSALLEAMAERQVSIDGICRPLAEGFFVIATQNPHDRQGTYPLPEAQLDRFAMRLEIGYPHRDDEIAMLAAACGVGATAAEEAPSLLAAGQLALLQDQVARVAVAGPVRGYLVDLAAASRVLPGVTLGASPRGALAWQRVAQARAWLAGRSFVVPDDIQAVAGPVLAVRLGVDGDDVHRVIGELLARVAVPVGA